MSAVQIESVGTSRICKACGFTPLRSDFSNLNLRRGPHFDLDQRAQSARRRSGLTDCS